MKYKRTYFTRKELVSFGNYMVCKARRDNIQIIRKEQGADINDIDRVYDADIANWKELNK